MQRSRTSPSRSTACWPKRSNGTTTRSFIQFNLNPKAKWSDGQPVTPEDVMFTFELMRDKGRPPFANRLNIVAKMEKVGERSVRFTFTDKADRETPLIFGLFPVLPKHAIDPAKPSTDHR